LPESEKSADPFILFKCVDRIAAEPVLWKIGLHHTKIHSLAFLKSLMETELVKKSRAYAEKALNNLPEAYTYHNLVHTQAVVNAADEIARHLHLSDDERETVLIAAWLHDVEYEKGSKQHEAISAEKATELLKAWNAPTDKIEAVKSAIQATQMPQRPTGLVEQVICDADLYHLSAPNMNECGELLRRELSELNDLKFASDEEWWQFNYNFLKAHRYSSPYGQTVLEERKKKNLKKLKKMLKHKPDEDYVKDLEKQLEKFKKKLDKRSYPERGIETMFRIASENHITLSGMADTKSNIMISVNSILISIVVTVLFNKLERFPLLLTPTLMLITGCLATVIFAVLATRPNVSSGKFTREDIENKKTNLLFFGNFHNMELKQYDWGMKEMMKDSDFLYSSLIKDLYFNGKVLSRKYKLLRISYTIFLFGFVSSIIGFTIVLLAYYAPVYF